MRRRAACLMLNIPATCVNLSVRTLTTVTYVWANSYEVLILCVIILKWTKSCCFWKLHVYSTSNKKSTMFIVYIAMGFRFQIQIIVIIDLFSNIHRCSVNSSVMKKQKCPHCESVFFVSPLNSSHCYNQSTLSWIWPTCSLKVAQIIASKAVTSSVKGTKAL